jgi:hypothetical protein
VGLGSTLVFPRFGWPLIVIGSSMRCGSGSRPAGANQGAWAGASGHSLHFRPTRSMPIGYTVRAPSASMCSRRKCLRS